MDGVLRGIDRLSILVGQAFAWCILALTGVVVYEIVMRSGFRAPTTWGYDVTYMLYGTLFMMAGAYALARNGHVRGDFLYRKFSEANQARLDLLLYLLFFFPAILAFIVSGWFFFDASFRQNERSMFSPTGPVIWPFKFLIPLVGVLLLLQGLAEVARCVRCIREGRWPPRPGDVEELDQIILAQAEAKGAEALAAEVASGRIPDRAARSLAASAAVAGSAAVSQAEGRTGGAIEEALRAERAGDQQDGR